MQREGHDMTDANTLAIAFQRLATGDQTPIRPWAYLSGLGLAEVSGVGRTENSNQAFFTVTLENGSSFDVEITAHG